MYMFTSLVHLVQRLLTKKLDVIPRENRGISSQQDEYSIRNSTASEANRIL